MDLRNGKKLFNKLLNYFLNKKCRIYVLDSNVVINLFLKGFHKKEVIINKLKEIDADYYIIDIDDLTNGIISYLREFKRKKKKLILSKELFNVLKSLNYPYLDVKGINIKLLENEELKEFAIFIIKSLNLLLNNNGLKVNFLSGEELDKFDSFKDDLEKENRKIENIKKEIKKLIIKCREENNKRKMLPKQEEFEDKDSDVELVTNTYLYFAEFKKIENLICFVTLDEDFCDSLSKFLEKRLKIKVLNIRQ